MAGAGASPPLRRPFFMGQTAITICNSAMFKLGARQVVGFDDGTPEADACKIRYPFCRNLLLRDHSWSFDRRIRTLAPVLLPDPMPEGWANRFLLPDDVGRLILVQENQCDVKYELAGNLIYSNAATLEIRYGVNYTAVDDGVVFPDDFAETLALYLACDLAMKLTQNANFRQLLEGQFMRRLAQARNTGAVELAPQTVNDYGWLQAHDNLLDPDIGARNLRR